MLLKNARILDENFCLQQADVAVENGRIAAVAPNLDAADTLPLSGYLLAPGFVDIHIHGRGGADTTRLTDCIQFVKDGFASVAGQRQVLRHLIAVSGRSGAILVDVLLRRGLRVVIDG